MAAGAGDAAELPAMDVLVAASAVFGLARRNREAALVGEFRRVAASACERRVRLAQLEARLRMATCAESLLRHGPCAVGRRVARLAAVRRVEAVRRRVARLALFALHVAVVEPGVAAVAARFRVAAEERKRAAVVEAGGGLEALLVVAPGAVTKQLAPVYVLVAGGTLLVESEKRAGTAVALPASELVMAIGEPEVDMLVPERGALCIAPCNRLHDVERSAVVVRVAPRAIRRAFDVEAASRLDLLLDLVVAGEAARIETLAGVTQRAGLQRGSNLTVCDREGAGGRLPQDERERKRENRKEPDDDRCAIHPKRLPKRTAT